MGVSTTKYDALLAAGLTANEAKMYLAMLRIGSASVNEISRKAGVHRVNAYDLIERLIQKGLVSSVVRGAKKLYEPASPHKILDMLHDRQAHVTSVMPELVLDFNLRKEKQDVFVFKGPEGVMSAYGMMLEQGKDIYALGGQGLNRKYLKHRHIKFDKARLKKKMKVHGLYYESARSKKIASKMWHIKYLPDKFRSPLMVDICGDLVIILLATTDILAIVIQNKEVADGYRKHFTFMWEFAKG
jgi:HTH-type transcriptional regulator, sugar sensing transcriptional regulator